MRKLLTKVWKLNFLKNMFIKCIFFVFLFAVALAVNSTVQLSENQSIHFTSWQGFTSTEKTFTVHKILRITKVEAIEESGTQATVDIIAGGLGSNFVTFKFKKDQLGQQENFTIIKFRRKN